MQLQKELRKDYPYYEPAQAVSVGAAVVDREARYLFRSRKKDWTVSFRASAIAGLFVIPILKNFLSV